MKKKINKVLIVEDDEDFLVILKTKFESEGFSVAIAKSGQEGIDIFEKNNPHLIVSDVLMSGMDGVEMVKKIRESNRKTPVIFLTNIDNIGILEKVRDQIGNFEYLIKSNIRIGEIVNKIKNALKIA